MSSEKGTEVSLANKAFLEIMKLVPVLGTMISTLLATKTELQIEDIEKDLSELKELFKTLENRLSTTENKLANFSLELFQDLNAALAELREELSPSVRKSYKTLIKNMLTKPENRGLYSFILKTLKQIGYEELIILVFYMLEGCCYTPHDLDDSFKSYHEVRRDTEEYYFQKLLIMFSLKYQDILRSEGVFVQQGIILDQRFQLLTRLNLLAKSEKEPEYMQMDEKLKEIAMSEDETGIFYQLIIDKKLFLTPFGRHFCYIIGLLSEEVFSTLFDFEADYKKAPIF